MSQKRGRKPKPTTLKLLQGNPGKRPINQEEPQAKPIFNPDPPAHFSDLQAAKWRDMAAQLGAVRVLTQLDLDALEIYCIEWVAMHAALTDLNERGKLLQAPSGGVMWNPSWTQYKHSLAQCRSLQSEFGLTPSSRTGVVADGDSEGKGRWGNI